MGMAGQSKTVPRETSEMVVMICLASAEEEQHFLRLFAAHPKPPTVVAHRQPRTLVEAIATCSAHVLLLDLALSQTDGVALVRHIMARAPLPIVVLNSLWGDAATRTVEALGCGAVAVLGRQPADRPPDERGRISTLETMLAAAATRVDRRADYPHPNVVPPRPRSSLSNLAGWPIDRLIALGASTGGTQALRQVLRSMPEHCPGILIVQHMPAGFTAGFARHLNEITAMQVSEAKDGDVLRQGVALVAPGNRHMTVRSQAKGYVVQLGDGHPVNQHRPSVDVLFRSVAEAAGPKATACLMTGMGTDGCRGLLHLRQNGGRTFAQNEATCVVFGMPAAAWREGAAEALVPVNEIGRTLLQAA